MPGRKHDGLCLSVSKGFFVREPLPASDDIQAAIRELFVFHKRHKTGMHMARYILENGRQGWGLVSEFEYDDNAS
jgi:hypothetical protein